MKILIIEDECLAAQRLSEILLQIDESITVVGIVDSIEQGIDWLSSNTTPNLIFSDIELADGLSFEIFKQIKTNCPIIFCTAYDQYMLEAFDINSISYILKPINREQVARAIEKYYTMREMFSENINLVSRNNQIETLLNFITQKNTKHCKSTLMMNSGKKIIPISVNDIAFVYATRSGLLIATTKGKEYRYSATLDELAAELDANKFCKVSRQFIIPRWSIASIERFFNRSLVIKLQCKTPERVSVSRLKAKDFLDWMQQ